MDWLARAAKWPVEAKKRKETLQGRRVLPDALRAYRYLKDVSINCHCEEQSGCEAWQSQIFDELKDHADKIRLLDCPKKVCI